MPDPTQSDRSHSDSVRSDLAPPDSSNPSPSTGRWLVKLPGAARVDRLSELNDDLIRAGRPSRRKRVLVAAARLAATFCIGVAATLAWQPYGDAARMMIANASPQLGWLAPQAAAAAAPDPHPRVAAVAAPSDLDAVRDRIDRIAATQEQMTYAVAQLTAGQQRIAEEIVKVREVEQYLLYKTSYKGEEVPLHKTSYKGEEVPLPPARPVASSVGRHKPTSSAR